MLTIENLLPYFRIGGDVYISESKSKDDFDEKTPPVTIIQDDQTLFIHLKWWQKGLMGCLIDRDSRWNIQVYFEQLGAKEVKKDYPPVKVPFQQKAHADYYTYIPVSDLEVGVYTLTVSMTLVGPKDLLTPIVAHEEIGHIQVYADVAR